MPSGVALAAWRVGLSCERDARVPIPTGMRLFEQLKNIRSPTWQVSWGSSGQGWARTGGDFERAKFGSRETGGVGIAVGRIWWGSCIKNANASA